MIPAGGSVTSKAGRIKRRMNEANQPSHGKRSTAMLGIGKVKMPKVTRATKVLEQAGIAFTVHSYDYGASRLFAV